MKCQIVVCLLASVVCVSYADTAKQQVAKARIESCKGCRLNRLPDVKKFIFEDVPLYEDVTFKSVPGASPELILLNKFDQELERIDLAPLSRKDCNTLLVDRGFHKKSEAETVNRNEF
ncbi:selenoprotein M-like [Schistocerca gregaria]|uniref:selenoprotein M-like n=1 Tax=Schistocerca cancellata TaxID=274614 RepID=UPI0021185816|nr:selenoprotein M-like [Schistocerca cancellata]XP_049860114.1 selenoprotein M-like [Schistocerca gregaria]